MEFLEVRGDTWHQAAEALVVSLSAKALRGGQLRWVDAHNNGLNDVAIFSAFWSMFRHVTRMICLWNTHILHVHSYYTYAHRESALQIAYDQLHVCLQRRLYACGHTYQHTHARTIHMSTAMSVCILCTGSPESAHHPKCIRLRKKPISWLY